MTENKHSETESERATPPTRGFAPEAVAEREDVSYTERTYPHEDEDHCEAEADGRVVVGIINEASEVLVLVDRERSHAILPNCTVDPDEEWRAVARRTVEGIVDVPVTIGDPEHVRRVEHTVAGTGTRHNVSFHVVFGGSAETASGDGPSVDDGTRWEAGWFDDLPVEIDAEEGDAIEDIRRFLD